MKRILLTAIMASLCTFAYAGKNAARVNGKKITEKQLQNRLYHTYGPSVSEELVIETLFLQKAKELNLKADKAKANEQYEKIKSQYASEDEFEKAIKERRLSVKDIKKQIELQMLSNLVVIKIEDISISEEQVKSFFDKNKDKFRKSDKAHLKQIVVKTKAQADEIMLELKAGKSFEELAKAKSLDKESAKQGGDIGIVSRARLAEKIAEQVFVLETGEYSQPIKTLNGYYILKMEDKIIADYDNMKGTIRENMIRTEIAKNGPKVVEKLKSNAEIEIYN